jgi:hypothetical protein
MSPLGFVSNKMTGGGSWRRLVVTRLRRLQGGLHYLLRIFARGHQHGQFISGEMARLERG